MQFLKDSQRIEDRSSVNGVSAITATGQSGVDFEHLVGSRSNGTPGISSGGTTSLEDDIWGSILSGTPVQVC